MAKIRIEVEVPDGAFCYNYEKRFNNRTITANCPYLDYKSVSIGLKCSLYHKVVTIKDTKRTMRTIKLPQCRKAEIKETENA